MGRWWRGERTVRIFPRRGLSPLLFPPVQVRSMSWRKNGDISIRIFYFFICARAQSPWATNAESRWYGPLPRCRIIRDAPGKNENIRAEGSVYVQGVPSVSKHSCQYKLLNAIGAHTHTLCIYARGFGSWPPRHTLERGPGCSIVTRTTPAVRRIDFRVVLIYILVLFFFFSIPQ